MLKPTSQQVNEFVSTIEVDPNATPLDKSYMEAEPGKEHYKLLSWFSLQYNNILITEIGTHIGLGTIALSYNKKNKVLSFDIKHRPGELRTPENAEKKMVYPEYMDEVMKSSIIFYDARHEGVEEQEFYDELKKRGFRGILILDDIHLNEPMQKFWDNIDLPKEDWSDIGHHSGTGVVFFYPDLIKHNEPLSFYVEKICNDEPFKFLRFGDGEFYVIKGAEKDIARGEHHVFPEITEDLRNIVTNLKPEHYNALQPLSQNLAHLNMLIPEWDWYYSDVFHEASEGGELRPFFECLKNKNVVIISNEKMKEIKSIINYNDFITVRDSDCYLDKEMVLKEIEEYPTGTIFLFCASRLAVPAIYHSERSDCTMIDLGSLLDPYINVLSRKYHSRITPKIMGANLPGKDSVICKTCKKRT